MKKEILNVKVKRQYFEYIFVHYFIFNVFLINVVGSVVNL